MALLGKADILEVDDSLYEVVSVPEWGGEVRLRVLSGSERDRYEASLAKMKNGVAVPDMANARARLVAWTAVDADGRRLFNDKDVLKLGDKSSRALSRLFDASCTLSGISEADVEELTEGFGDGPSESSISD